MPNAYEVMEERILVLHVIGQEFLRFQTQYLMQAAPPLLSLGKAVGNLYLALLSSVFTPTLHGPSYIQPYTFI